MSFQNLQPKKCSVMCNQMVIIHMKIQPNFLQIIKCQSCCFRDALQNCSPKKCILKSAISVV